METAPKKVRSSTYYNQSQYLFNLVHRTVAAEISRVIRQEVRIRLDKAAIAKAVEQEIENTMKEIGVSTTSNYAA